MQERITGVAGLFFGGLLIWWLSRSETITLCFVVAVGALEVFYQELRRVNRTLEAIEKKLNLSS